MKAKVIKMSQGKVVSQNIAIILGVLCAVFALVAVGAFIVPHGSTGGDDAAYAALQASNSAYVNDHSHTNADYENLKSQLQQAQSQLSGSSGDSSTISQLQSQIDSLNSQISQKNADISSLNSWTKSQSIYMDEKGSKDLTLTFSEASFWSLNDLHSQAWVEN